MRLHYLPGTAAMAPHATLAEIGVPYELVRVERDEDGRPSDAYLALNPWGKIPTLEDGDLVYGGEGVKDAADAELAGHYDRIDTHLAGREWLVGGERTIADFFLFMLTRWGRFLEPAAWERPNLQAHWLRTLQLRGPRTVFEEQGLPLPEFATA